jgi:hypothetical protein
MTPRLDGIGDELERAARADLRSRRVRRRRIVGGAAALAVLLPGGAVAATLLSTEDVARSQTADGRLWQCYIGQEAVRQQIVGPDLLGAYAPSPGVG